MELEMEKFPFGKVISVHRISTFEIIEYKPDPVYGTEQNTVEFSVNGCSYDTLDQALLGALCEKYNKDDSLFRYAARLLSME